MIITINTKEDSHDEIKRAIEVLRSIVESGQGYSNYNDYGSGSSSSTPNYDNSPNYNNTQPTNTAPVVNDGLFNLFNDDPVPTPQSAYPQQPPTYPQTQPGCCRPRNTETVEAHQGYPSDSDSTRDAKHRVVFHLRNGGVRDSVASWEAISANVVGLDNAQVRTF